MFAGEQDADSHCLAIATALLISSLDCEVWVGLCASAERYGSALARLLRLKDG